MTIPDDVGDPDLSWTVTESEVYKDKDLLSIECPDIPHDAAGARTFWNSLKMRISAIDRSAEDHLTVWIDVPRAILGDLKGIMERLHTNSQGLVRLDRYLGMKIAEKAKDHPIFAVRFASYIEQCHHCNRSPKGRVMLAIIAQRFRLDRARGKAISILHLYSIDWRNRR